MKASELFKHLEEGGRIKPKNHTFDYDYNAIDDGLLIDIFDHPNNYEIAKPKKKIKLYRYTYQGEDNYVWETCWSTEPSHEHKNCKLLKTEEKEIEVDDDA